MERFGYIMTEEQSKELDKILEEDILERYNNSQYWDERTIEGFAIENNLKEV